MVPCEQPREASSASLCEACSASVERDGVLGVAAEQGVDRMDVRAEARFKQYSI